MQQVFFLLIIVSLFPRSIIVIPPRDNLEFSALIYLISNINFTQQTNKGGICYFVTKNDKSRKNVENYFLSSITERIK